MKLVVLGRDGVINEARDEGVTTPDEWVEIPGSLEAIARLNRAGIRVVVATNQHVLRDNDDMTVDDLHDIHEKMLRLIHEAGGAVDAIFFSSTGNPRSHGKRQPKVDLLQQVRDRSHIDFKDMVVVGDGREDLDAAAHVGARPVMVQTGAGREVLGDLQHFEGVTVYSDLAAAVDALLS